MNARLEQCACCAEKDMELEAARAEVQAMRDAFASELAVFQNEIKTYEAMVNFADEQIRNLVKNGPRHKAGWPAELERRHPARVARDAEKAAKEPQ